MNAREFVQKRGIPVLREFPNGPTVDFVKLLEEFAEQASHIPNPNHLMGRIIRKPVIDPIEGMDVIYTDQIWKTEGPANAKGHIILKPKSNRQIKRQVTTARLSTLHVVYEAWDPIKNVAGDTIGYLIKETELPLHPSDWHNALSLNLSASEKVEIEIKTAAQDLCKYAHLVLRKADNQKRYTLEEVKELINSQKRYTLEEVKELVAMALDNQTSFEETNYDTKGIQSHERLRTN